MSALLAGCSNEATSLESSQNENELGINAVVSNSVATKTGFIDKLDELGTEIKILAYRDNEDADKILNAVFKYTLHNSVNKYWDNQGTAYYVSPLETRIYGYTPIDANPSGTFTSDPSVVNKIEAVVPTETMSDLSNTNDYMYATADEAGQVIAKASNGIGKNKTTIYFHHAMAKITFIINLAESYKAGVGKLNSMKLTAKGTNKFLTGTGAMSLVDGTFSNFTSTDNITFKADPAIQLNAYVPIPGPQSTTELFSMLIPPVKQIGPIGIELNLDTNVKMYASLPIATPDELKPGYNYLYTLTVKDNNINISEVKIIDWITTSLDGGDATTLPMP